MKGTISPFDFSQLPKISRAKLLSSRATADFHLDIDDVNSTLRGLLQNSEAPLFSNYPLILKSHSFVKGDLALESSSESKTTVQGFLTNEAIPFALSLQKQDAKLLVHHLLGGDTSLASGSDLTPIEEGVFTFLVTSVMHAIREHFLDGFGLSLRLAPMESTIQREIFHSSSQVLELSFQVDLPARTIKINLLVDAHQSLLSLFVKPRPSSDLLSNTLELVQAASFPVTAHIGEFSLSADELLSLEVDDIVLLDSSGIKLDSNVLSGEMTCNIGEPTFESIRGRLSLSESGNYFLAVSKSS